MKRFFLTLETRSLGLRTFELGLYNDKYTAYQQAIKMFPRTPFTLKEK